jgi:hypothetical protein
MATVLEPYAETYKSTTTNEFTANGGIPPKIHRGYGIQSKAQGFGIGTRVQTKNL